MSTVAELADRVYREFLYPSDDQPIVASLSSAILAADTSVPYSDSTLYPDEEDVLAPGTLIEFADGEQARITAVNDSTNIMTVKRGVNGTTAADQASGSTIVAAPVFPRRAVIDAVKDNVVNLYPDLWQIVADTFVSAAGIIEVPAGILSIQEASYVSGSRLIPAQVTEPRRLATSSTGWVVQAYGVPNGATVYLTYRGKFTYPPTDATDVATLGVEREWERIVVVGAAAHLISGRSIDPVSAEYITEQMERESFPVGSASRIAESLLRYRNFLLDQSNRNLRAQDAVPVVMNF